ncbi:uncharacterized protein METZ01_LOCUS14930 [marine metagenome]|uniref:Uncharacterized protein n=1 Tax=marine metagenome TaxID=408172 RepID=A0A381P552_9ZZZZ
MDADQHILHNPTHPKPVQCIHWELRIPQVGFPVPRQNLENIG